MLLGTLGTTTVDGDSSYDARANPLLETVLVHTPQGSMPMHPRNYASLHAATVIARVVGGTVVRDPHFANLNTTQPALGIKLGEKIANAGNICDALGNDCGFAGPGQKSQDICKQLGIPFDPRLADVLYDALVLR
ncbi:MAG: hypothetical protein K0Q71_2140 [Thermomicrobiales bacterium]|jgi:hypothetical protein|nr:hypothetical protein [Thermomicrobiales bacterium]